MPSAPYYADDLVTLYLGDCREITEWLAADVLVTDPPYGRDWRQGEVKSTGSTVGHARNEASQTGIANDKDTTVRDAALALWGTERRAILFGDLMLAPPVGTRLVCGYRKALDAGLRGAMGGVRRDLEAIYLIGKWGSGIGGRTSLFATRAPLVGSPRCAPPRPGRPRLRERVMTTPCPRVIHWWDIDTDSRCTRTFHHAGDHTDGDRWWDGYGLRRPQDPPRPAKTKRRSAS